MNEVDAILKEHASDVAQTVSCNMTKQESRDLAARFRKRLDRMQLHDPRRADLFRRALGSHE